MSQIQNISSVSDQPILEVMVNGIPGKMGISVAEAVLNRGLRLVPYSLCSERCPLESFEILGQKIQLIKPSQREQIISQIKNEHPQFISIDYTHPSAVNSNGDFYSKNQLPFVLGTTGFDREALFKTVREAGVSAVIAPNMGKQIVALQAMLDWAGTQFPGVFTGYNLHVEETHQKAKSDTSGTAKAIVESFNRMGLPYEESDIRLCRNDEEAVAHFKVPRAHVAGHAYHTYTITSEDGNVQFEIKHNVCGRSLYAEGSVDAAEFLFEKVSNKTKQNIYNMIDILQQGAMK